MDTVSNVCTDPNEPCMIYTDLASFKGAVQTASGREIDFDSVIALRADFLNATDDYAIINVHDYGVDEDYNLLFLTERVAYLYTRRPPAKPAIDMFRDLHAQPFGPATVLAFVTLSKVLDSYKPHFESFLTAFKKLDESFSYQAYRELATQMDRFNDHLEDFQDLLLHLQERYYKQVETRYLSFDYSVLIAECASLQNRARRRMALLKDLREDHDAHTTHELNQRIAKLNDVVRTLTAITVLLMLPTLIASHFGMNFKYMPELDIPWVYPAVIFFQLLFMGIAWWIFRRMRWL